MSRGRTSWKAIATSLASLASRSTTSARSGRPDGGGHADPDGPETPVADRPHPDEGRVGRCEDVLAGDEQLLARRRESYGVRRALQQRDCEFAFERGDRA